MSGNIDLNEAVQAVGNGMLAVAIERTRQQRVAEVLEPDEQAEPTLEDVGLTCDCQHCGVCFVQPHDPHCWYRYCPYCAERVMPYFTDGDENGGD